MFVVTGPIYQDPGGQERVIEAEGNPCRNEIRLPPLAKTSICDANDDDDDARCANGVAVPSALYKIIYDPGNQRVNAYVLPNLNHTPLKQSMTTREYLNRHRASVGIYRLRFLDGAQPPRSERDRGELSCHVLSLG
jgi:endonuclease G, mitochondrial